MNGELLYKKSVDKSMLFNGITLPIKYHQQLYDKFGYIEEGSSIRLVVWLMDEAFDILLSHVSFTNKRSEVMQIRYSSSKNGLPRRLREIFPFTTAYAKKCDEYKEMELPTPKLSESDKEFVDIMMVDDGFEFVCYPNGNVFEADEKVEPECETEIIARPTIVTTQSDTSRQETIDSAASNTNTMNFLIAKGKFRGYIKESEILAAFPEGTDVEKFEEILATINDNGIELRWE